MKFARKNERFPERQSTQKKKKLIQIHFWCRVIFQGISQKFSTFNNLSRMQVLFYITKHFHEKS